MVVEVLADAGQFVLHPDAVLLQLRRGADARQKQDLRRVDGAAGDDDLAPRRQDCRAAILGPDGDADSALAIEVDVLAPAPR